MKFYRKQPEAAVGAIAPELGLSAVESLQVMNQLVWLNSAEQPNGRYLVSAEKPGAFASVLKDSADLWKNKANSTSS
ncbi:MAG: hypothetical protein LH660_10985 [Phormidesmis sp. CAN_BIN36]|nr:hypothetical protein [Phormidesmis sp. CAN_BIN36]